MKSYFHDIPAIAYRGPDSDDAPHPGRDRRPRDHGT